MGIDESKRATLRRFAAVGAASPLVGLADEAAGESDVPGAIGGYLTTTPGAHFSKLRDDLQLGTGEAQHHLRRLVDAGAVESYRDGDYRRFYPAGEFADLEKITLGYLRRETPRSMLVTLLRDPDADGAALADAADVSRGTISKYAAELEGVGLLSRDDGYAITQPEMVLVLVVRYADSFGDAAAALAREADALVAYDP
ncbi:winged helix-turn-helix transcriptional regulator [Halarchaeum nitratireducens]|uniref:MarR family transcriptional regulator n=1 Tax=Halarchaeum nitratireducens TaxID=489913 RepID=A0A830GAH9_9EURY|nr:MULTISPECIES: MarR family transcriptional regulator [Halarchaeum]MBP2251527.1 putative transcriptional regulator [Halarchaeum solikamskense]GGN14252.1 MarR family transcriptional regulator [Halarchaeum nitratireducens]